MSSKQAKSVIYQSRHLLIYGCVMAILVFLLKWLQWKYLITDHAIEIYIGLIAVFFTGLGVWVATQLLKSKTIIVEKKVLIDRDSLSVNKEELDRLQLTKREHDVLEQIVKGHSNAVIAKNLFLSESTIKTHASNLYVKMDVKSRAQVIEKAKRLRITL